MSSTSPNANANALPHSVSSDLSPPSSTTTISPSWAPPRLPLPPYRLAKIANALGVATPMPAIHHIHRSRTTSPSPSDVFGRSLTPSTLASSSSAYSNPISKYLLHVIPPPYLPHDPDNDNDNDNDNDMTQPPATASGYHTQFRRGILVPVHSTLQSQLGAIAKEYALPSTAGLILYLVSSAASPNNHLPTAPQPNMTLLNGDIADEPGPRLSEDIWKHLWTRVSKAEQREDILISPSIGVPLGMSLAARSTPYLHQDLNGHTLRPFLSTNETASHPLPPRFPSSPTTASTVSDLRSNAKSTQRSTSSVDDPETPDTSSAAPSFLLQDSATRANSLDLPGLISPSIIPVLAKVEFDIDRRKATWYEPWLRSRRLNHAKRAESRNGRRVEGTTDVPEELDNAQDQRGHIRLLTGTETATFLPVVEKLTLSSGEMELEDSSTEEFNEDENRWSDDDDDDDDDFEPTARVPLTTKHNDSSQSVFGDDEGVSSPSEYEATTSGEDAVQALLNEMTRSNLSISITAPEKRSSSPTVAKKHVPPPLVLIPGESANDLAIPAEATPSPSPISSAPSSAGLAYLKEGESEESPTDRQYAEDDSNDLDIDYTRIRTPEETEKRGGAVFDDLDLGLDPTADYDHDDPHDQRRSQFIMKAQLDEIERTMAQLSPRILQADLAEEQTLHGPPFSPSGSSTLSPGKFNSDYYPPSPRLPQRPEPDVTDLSRSNSQATRFSISRITSLNGSPPRRKIPPSPPRLAVNGMATSSPKLDILDPKAAGLGRRELQGNVYPTISSTDLGEHADSPIIPLSPDPFGRFSSTSPASNPLQQPMANWDSEPAAKPLSVPVATLTPHHESTNGPETRKRSQSTATSRFSADSMTGVENPKSNNRTTMSINAFKKLWRKSSKPATGASRPPTPNGSSMPPVRPERPSQDILNDRPRTPMTGRHSPQLMPPRQPHEVQLPVPIPQGSPLLPPSPNPQQSPNLQQMSLPRQPGPILSSAPPPPPSQAFAAGQPPFSGRSANPQPIVAAQMRPSRSASQLDRLHFDQESPYPTRRHPSFSRPPSPPPLPSPHIQSTHIPSATPTTPVGGAFPPLGPPIVLQEKDRSSVRKSILKGWKSSSISSTTSLQQPPSTTPEPRTSMERPGSGASRSRRPSVLNFGSTRSSVTSPLPEIPPSPQIPQRFIPGGDNRQSIRSRLTSSSVDLHSPPRANKPLSTASSSPRRSIASSHGSRESRPSFDTSQFEIVSPKSSALTYPYHGLDHSP